MPLNPYMKRSMDAELDHLEWEKFFSLHASKFINGLEGGYVCTNDSHFATALKDFRLGQAVFYNNCLHTGLSGIPIDVHAAFALAGLDEIEANVNP